MTNEAKQICRFLRVLEYVGTREDLTEARERRQVKGTSNFNARVKIFEGILGDADQPIIGQLKLWCCQQIVAAADGRLYAEKSEFRDGYVKAIQDVLRLALPKTAYEELLGEHE